MGYFRSAATGVTWLSSLRGLIRGLTFVRLLFLARMLTPQQFGTFGVATLTLAFIEVLTETGVNIVLVQEDRSSFEKYLNSAWVISIIRGLIIFLLLLVTAPIIAHFFNNPDSLPLLILISLVPLVRGFINPSVVLFQKELRFDKEVAFKSTIVITGTIVTIILAYITRSPLSLVIGMLFEASLEVVLSFLVIKQKPTFEISKSYLSHIFHRGKWITLAGLFNYLYQQLDDIVVGRKLSATDLGLYQMAYRLAMLPMTEIADVFNRVTFPVYAKLVQDKKRLRSAYLKTTAIIAVLSTSFGVALLIFPTFIVQLLLGPQWLAIVSILPILAITGVIRGISISAFSLFLAQKKQDYVLYTTIASVAVLAVLIIPLTTLYGLEGAAYSALIGSIAALPLTAYYVLKVFH